MAAAIHSRNYEYGNSNLRQETGGGGLNTLQGERKKMAAAI